MANNNNNNNNEIAEDSAPASPATPCGVVVGTTMTTTTSTGAIPVRNYDRFFNESAIQRQPTPLRAMYPLYFIPGMISLAGGLPNPSTFPISSVSFTLNDGTEINVSPKEVSEHALQYSLTNGIPPLYKWMKEHQVRYHNPPACLEWDVSVISGSQHGLSMAFELFVSKGDTVLVEDPSYPGGISCIKPLGAALVGVPLDGDGIIPERLEHLLANWTTDPTTKNKSFPKLLYVIPTGQNPTGSTLPTERKRTIYDIASRYDLLIIEDDPYYHLFYGEERPRSFFSMDTDGRVLRFDSMSKIISAGLRLGFVCGPKPIIDKMVIYIQNSIQNTSGIAQVMVNAIFEKWGWEGFEKHLRTVQDFYRSKRDLAIRCIERYLGPDKVEFSVPTAGMFLWLRLKNVQDTRQLILVRAQEKKVLLVPGVYFSPNDVSGPYVRLSFSLATDEAIEEAIKRFADLIN